MIPAFKMQNIWGKLYLTWIFIKVKHEHLHLLVTKYLTSVRQWGNEQAAMGSNTPVCSWRVTNKQSREEVTLKVLFLMVIIKEALALIHLESKCLCFLTVNTISWNHKLSIEAFKVQADEFAQIWPYSPVDTCTSPARHHKCEISVSNKDCCRKVNYPSQAHVLNCLLPVHGVFWETAEPLRVKA